MELAELDYPLPPGAIAQTPAEPREAARLLVVDRTGGAFRDHVVRELPELLRPGDWRPIAGARSSGRDVAVTPGWR